jgi:MFS family permease
MQADSTGQLAYRWAICACSFLVLFVSNGMTLGGMAVFDIELMKSLSEITGSEISVTQIKLRDTIMFATASICGLGAGWLADKVGVKPMILVGLAILAAGNFLYANIQSLTQIYWIQAGFGVVLALCGLMINVYLISSWFEKGRGLAIGLVLAGTSLGNAFFPKLNTWLMTIGDWREVFGWIALVPLALLPIAFFVLRNGPNSAGKNEAGDGGMEGPKVLPGYTLGEALKNRNFWIVAIIAMCTFYSILGMSANVFIYMSKSDFSPADASTGVSILFIGGLIGKVVAGFLAESFGRKRILLTGLALMLAGAVSLLIAIQSDKSVPLWAGLIAFGFGWGGIYTLIQLLSSDLFGMRALGKILAAVNILDAAGGALGPVVTGLLYDTSGSYFLPFAVITALLLVATIAASLLNVKSAAYLEPASEPV